MNDTDRTAAIHAYLGQVSEQFYSGHAVEHAYRPALQALISKFDDTVAVNDPKHSEHGAPDFVFLKKSNNRIIKGYAEAKDITVNLDRTEQSEQMRRYHGYANLILTDYLEFRFFRNGEKYETISLGSVKNGVLHKAPEHGERLMREIESFMQQAPESIRSGKRLAQIMGGKARRIRDNVAVYLQSEDESSAELRKIYEMMKRMLVHDLEPAKFADMYAQTLVYGLFVARYGDTSPGDFTRAEARDLVPRSNPFLRHFFDHIVGPSFDTRLGYIVDELCEIFTVSDVAEIVHKHLRIGEVASSSDAKDPIIHFYEDFLQEYDPAERKRMGAYYTPTPVVRYIVRQVDRILREDFGLARGLASTDTVQYQVETGQDLRADKRSRAQTTQTLTVPRVQVLDPAVGTATFLNETIKFIYESFRGQEGRWPGYVNDNLLPRLHGFELMMAPYTIAHLKLGMTLRETGVDSLRERLGVYLTNTLEEGIPQQPDLFSFGLAEAVSEESRLAAEVKSERPVMVVMGNPPYSGESSNKTKYANSLVNKYKFEPGGKEKLNEKNIKWIGNDYVKFIAFAEDMIARNGEGVIAMITSNTFLDGLIYRGMRWHLTKTFDKIYIYDLHGSGIKGGPSEDESVFDILQGTSIIIGVRQNSSVNDRPATVFHANLLGKRKSKFKALQAGEPNWTELQLSTSTYNFTQTNLVIDSTLVSLDSLFVKKSMGLLTKNDSFCIDMDEDSLWQRVDSIRNMEAEHARIAYGIKKDSRDWKIDNALYDVKMNYSRDFVRRFNFRPFDTRYTYYTGQSKGFIAYPQRGILQHMDQGNVGLIIQRQTYGHEFRHAFITDDYTDLNFISNLGGGTLCPLYLYHPDGTRTPNFAPAELSALTRQLTSEPSPEDVLDYIYAILHSPGYRERYREFLKVDFPRVPIPTQAEFDRLVPLGRQLRELHLMKSPDIDAYETVYPVPGSDVVEKIEFKTTTTDSVDGVPYHAEGAVYINETQFFGGVPEAAWNFYIGGYQPAQKWLKDRRGRRLTSDDLDHYQRIVKILTETDRVMKEIG